MPGSGSSSSTRFCAAGAFEGIARTGGVVGLADRAGVFERLARLGGVIGLADEAGVFESITLPENVEWKAFAGVCIYIYI